MGDGKGVVFAGVNGGEGEDDGWQTMGMPPPPAPLPGGEGRLGRGEGAPAARRARHAVRLHEVRFVGVG